MDESCKTDVPDTESCSGKPFKLKVVNIPKLVSVCFRDPLPQKLQKIKPYFVCCSEKRHCAVVYMSVV